VTAPKVSFACKYAFINGESYVRVIDVQYGIRLIALQLPGEGTKRALNNLAYEFEAPTRKGSWKP